MDTSQTTTCSVDGCDRPTLRLTLCSPHYYRNYRTGNPLSKTERVNLGLEDAAPAFQCAVDGCDGGKCAKGLCRKHYVNQLRHGVPVSKVEWTLNQTLDAIGWDVTEHGCWEWRGSLNRAGGYGILTLTRQGIRSAGVHRLMYERYVAPIPEGLLVRHKCDNPPCCNPDHLETGTHQDNMDDMARRGRRGTRSK